MLADLRTAGEIDKINVRVRDHIITNVAAKARHRIEHAVRKSGLLEACRHLKRAQRALRRRLKEDCVAAHQRGSNFGDRKIDWIIEREIASTVPTGTRMTQDILLRDPPGKLSPKIASPCRLLPTSAV